MEKLSFIITIFIMLIGPIKLIPAFARLTHGTERRFKRDAAFKAFLISTAICAFVALAARTLITKYQLSVQALQITAGLILLISALSTIFWPPPASTPAEPPTNALKLALAPLATPVIVSPVGVAAILTLVMIAPSYPGMYRAIAIALALVMTLNFLVMFFNDGITRLPGLLPTLQLLGAVLIVVQVAFAIEVMLDALRSLGLFHR